MYCPKQENYCLEQRQIQDKNVSYCVSIWDRQGFPASSIKMQGYKKTNQCTNTTSWILCNMTIVKYIIIILMIFVIVMYKILKKLKRPSKICYSII